MHNSTVRLVIRNVTVSPSFKDVLQDSFSPNLMLHAQVDRYFLAGLIFITTQKLDGWMGLWNKCKGGNGRGYHFDKSFRLLQFLIFSE